jgi:hypothetical protein
VTALCAALFLLGLVATLLAVDRPRVRRRVEETEDERLCTRFSSSLKVRFPK